MGCCGTKPILIKDDYDNDKENENEKDKSSSMVIINYDPNEEAKKNKRNRLSVLNGNDDVLSEDDNEDDDDDDYDMIAEYIIDENGNRIKVLKKVKRTKGEDDLNDIDNLSEAQKAKMTPNELLHHQKTHKRRLELTMKLKAEAKNEYLKHKDTLDPVEKACTVRIDYFKPQIILAEYAIKIHKDIINCIITLKEIELICYSTCSEDKMIKFWTEDFELVDEIETDQEPFVILQYNSLYLLSAEFNVIIAYEFGSYRKVFIFKDHLNKINSIALMSDMGFVSGGNDCIIRLWVIDFNCSKDEQFDDADEDSDGHCIQCSNYFDGHSSAVIKVIELEHDIIISCSDDKSVIIWDSKTLLVIVKMNNYFTTIELVNTGDGFLLGAYDNKLRLYSNDIQMVQVFKGKYYNVKHILPIGKDHYSITNSTKKVFVIDKAYKNIEYIYKGQKSIITGMVSYNSSKTFVTSGDDGKVYIWPKPVKQQGDDNEDKE